MAPMVLPEFIVVAISANIWMLPLMTPGKYIISPRPMIPGQPSSNRDLVWGDVCPRFKGLGYRFYSDCLRGYGKVAIVVL